MRQHFHLTRKEDVSGVSGVGIVAEGEVFSTGEVAIHWISGPIHSTTVYRSIDEVIKVHGHEGRTIIEWES